MASALRHNTPLLEGLGSFESKLSNSSAQPRYLSVRMNALLPLLFRAADQRHVDQDPVTQQPLFLMPVLPPLLLNSSRGLCSGFKGHVPPFHPADVALLVTEALRALRERAEDPQAWVQRYGQLWSLRELRCGGCTLEERGATLEEIFPWFRDAPGAYLFVKSERMAPRCWMGENNENVSVNWKKQEKDEPLGVPPARVQQVVVDYLVPIALRERYRVCSPEPREKLIRLESDHLQRQPVCDLPGATWTMGVLSPWSYQDDVLDGLQVCFSKMRTHRRTPNKKMVPAFVVVCLRAGHPPGEGSPPRRGAPPVAPAMRGHRAGPAPGRVRQRVLHAAGRLPLLRGAAAGQASRHPHRRRA